MSRLVALGLIALGMMMINVSCARKEGAAPQQPPAGEKAGEKAVGKVAEEGKAVDGKGAGEGEDKLVLLDKPAEDGKAAGEEKVIIEGKPTDEEKPSTPASATEAQPPAQDQIANRKSKIENGVGAFVDTGLGFKHLPIAEIEKRARRFAPVPITWDKSLLDARETELVRALVRAARAMDQLFWAQASPDGLEWRKRLASMTQPAARSIFHYMMINYSAYDRLDDMEPYLGEKLRPAGGNFYPEDMPGEEFEKWLAEHPQDEAAFKSNFTVIRRQDGKLVARPYSQEYQRELSAAEKILLEAAALTDNESLKKYLTSRAAAFLSDDYYQSDKDWMDVDSKIEVTIGPYEVYEDRLFGYKAAFEAFVTLKDPVASAKLDTFKEWLDRLEQNLPIPDEHKNFKRGNASPLLVVDVIFSAGDTRAGVQTIAFNLPNDERVREEKGSKKVMLRNVGNAKFDVILRPIAARVLDESLYPLLHRDAYSNHTLLHEISHGLGPGTIRVNGQETTVNLALKEIYSHLEEAKADTLGLYNCLHLIDQGVVVLPALKEGAADPEGRMLTPDEAKHATIVTFLAGIFRSTRFGTEEAHGKANLIIFNYMFEKGAFLADSAARMSYDYDKSVAAIRDLAHDILMIQSNGDYEGGKAFIEKYGTVGPAMASAFSLIDDVPVDIEPIYELP